MAAEGVSFDEWTRKAALRFLQSVMVIDDQATFDVPRGQPSGPLVAPDPVPVSYEEDEPESDDDPTVQPESVLDVKVLSDRFADHGLICGVLRPDADEPLSRQAIPAATRADIVLLDWRLGDRGERVLELIDKLASVGGLRLIAVYTSAGALAQIASRICATVRRGCVHEPGSFSVTTDSLTIEVYSKEGAGLDPSEQHREVATADLADRLISDFVRKTHGIVPSAAVAAIGEVRAGTPKILRRLGRDLDAGYLGHRTLLPDPDESGDHLIELITSELSAVVEDSALVRTAVGRSVVDAYVDQLQLAQGELSRETLRLMLEVGTAKKTSKDRLRTCPDVNDQMSPKLWGKNVGSQTLRFKQRDEAAALAADQRFATLLALKSPASNTAPRLTLGTIVSAGDGSYLICLQPGCDSVRLDHPRPFLFLPMRVTEQSRFFDLFVEQGAGEYVPLEITREPYALQIREFTPDAVTRVVPARKDGSDRYQFTASDGGQLTFVAQLRASHAQDVAHHLAQKVGRVALDQSEVLRAVWNRQQRRDRDRPSSPDASNSGSETAEGPAFAEPSNQ